MSLVLLFFFFETALSFMFLLLNGHNLAFWFRGGWDGGDLGVRGVGFMYAIYIFVILGAVLCCMYVYSFVCMCMGMYVRISSCSYQRGGNPI